MQTQVIERTREVLATAAARYNRPALEAAQIKFDLRGRATGQARQSGDSLWIRYNLEALQLDPDRLLRETIPHEVAHLVRFLRGGKGGHGRSWLWLCRDLGGSGDRCHNVALTPARKTRKFAYRVPGYGELNIGAIRHKKIQRGVVYRVDGHKIDSNHFTGECYA